MPIKFNYQIHIIVYFK